MKIAILGTSNSVMPNGWVSAIKEFHEVDNYSIGASCAAVHLSSIKEYDISNYELVIIDSSINDYGHYEQSKFTLDEINEIWISIFTELLIRNDNCLYINFPCERGINSDKRKLLSRRIIETANNFEIRVIDLYRIFEDTRESLCEKYFRDENHLMPNLSRLIGFQILTLLKSYTIKNTPSKIKKIKVKSKFKLFKLYNSNNYRLKSSSIIKQNVASVKRIKTGKNILGFLHWAEKDTKYNVYVDDKLRGEFKIPGGYLSFEYINHIIPQNYKKNIVIEFEEKIDLVSYVFKEDTNETISINTKLLANIPNIFYEKLKLLTIGFASGRSLLKVHRNDFLNVLSQMSYQAELSGENSLKEKIDEIKLEVSGYEKT
ncbi:hypothetical protein FJN13_16175 [Alteromonas mediterranea]|uniref:hypothetical protein n=1 Tax=Alteromonas mediterranea TaxID=314275 RepID=UPI001131E187|nr:hypothetical protein [Alteromonas mediterranea]QDG36249.1 hypothetical protein FJN13_16175 [Alteromonas mediterranea]